MAPPDQKMYCGQCRNWKPERAHHCSICDICVLKMDHHCPWLVNCVGYHNFKAFFLFSLYQAIVGVLFVPQMVKFCFFSPDDTPSLSPLGTIFLWATNILAVPISVALFPLSLRIMHQILNNATSIEMMAPIQMKVPCISSSKARDGGKLHPNAYDMLWLNNFKQVMGPHFWTWPFPWSPEMKGQGLLPLKSSRAPKDVKRNGLRWLGTTAVFEVKYSTTKSVRNRLAILSTESVDYT